MKGLPDWTGRTAYLIGGGPSLCGFDFKRLKGEAVIGCNDAFRLGADLVPINIFGDSQWFHRTREAVRSYKGTLVGVAPSLRAIRLPRYVFIERDKHGLSLNRIAWNYSTGAASINLALRMGATTVVLLGFDLCRRGNKSHWHAHTVKPTKDEAFSRFRSGFSAIQQALPHTFPGCQILNAVSGEYGLDLFPIVHLSEIPLNPS